MSVRSVSYSSSFLELHPLCRICHEDLSALDKKISECVTCNSPQWCSAECKAKQLPNHLKYCVTNPATDKITHFFHIINQSHSAILYPYLKQISGGSYRKKPGFLFVDANALMPIPRSLVTLDLWFPGWKNNRKFHELCFEVNRQAADKALVACYQYEEHFQIYLIGNEQYTSIFRAIRTFPDGLIDLIEKDILELRPEQQMPLKHKQTTKKEEKTCKRAEKGSGTRKKPPSSKKRRRRRNRRNSKIC